MSCEEMHELAPELALDIVDGEQRAEALRHLSACADCRRLVEQLSEVADELLTLAPAQEPPLGFESRVLERLDLPAARRRRRRPGLALRVASPLAAAAATAAVMVAAYRDDRVTASYYRAALDAANGRSFEAQPLRDPAGTRAGIAFSYEGNPSWIVLTVDPGHRAGVASGEVVTRAGRAVRLPGFRLRSDGTWGGGIPVNLREVASIRLLGRRPGEVLQATPRRDEH